MARHWTVAQAAEKMGRSYGGYLKLERGERELKEKGIARASEVFGVPTSVIMSDEVPRIGHRPAPEVLGERDLKVFAAAEGGAGEMVVSTDPIEVVQRPWYLRDVREGFAVLITGESMVPAFEPGDIAVVNPRLPHMRGKDVILVRDEDEGEFKATIKRLVRWTEKEWYLHQFNPPRGQEFDFSLARRLWPKALRVVGKYYGG